MSTDRTADRLDIQETLARYSWGLTDKDYVSWLACFTDDATVDYTTAGGPAAPATEAAGWLESTAAMFDVMISHGGNVVVDFTGDDDAEARSIYKVTMRIPGETPTYMEACGYYRDRLRRTAAGWRIAHRHEEMVYLR